MSAAAIARSAAMPQLKHLSRNVGVNACDSKRSIIRYVAQAGCGECEFGLKLLQRPGWTEDQRFVHAPDLFASNFREERMTRTALIAFAGGTAIIFAAPAAAQSTGQQAVGQQPSAQPSAAPAANAAVPPVNGDDASPTPSDRKPNAKTKDNSHRTCGTAVRAGPNQGQVIGKCRKDTNDDAPPKS
jgi:hypothetical protein